MTALSGDDTAPGLRHQLWVETSDRPASPLRNYLALLPGLLPGGGDLEVLAADRPLPHLALASTQLDRQPLTLRSQQRGESRSLATLSSTDRLVIQVAVPLFTACRLTTAGWRVVQVVRQLLQDPVRVPPDPLHHRPSVHCGTDSLQRPDAAGDSLVVFFGLYHDPALLLKLALTLLNWT